MCVHVGEIVTAGVGECLQESQQSNKCLTTALSYILAILTSEVRGHVTSHPVCGGDRDGECGGVPVWVCACVSQTHPLQVQSTVYVCNHCMHFQYTINGYITTLDTPPLPEHCSH